MNFLKCTMRSVHSEKVSQKSFYTLLGDLFDHIFSLATNDNKQVCSSVLIILCMNLKITLWMSTHRTNFRCLGSYYNMSAPPPHVQ